MVVKRVRLPMERSGRGLRKLLSRGFLPQAQGLLHHDLSWLLIGASAIILHLSTCRFRVQPDQQRRTGAVSGAAYVIPSSWPEWSLWSIWHWVFP